MTNWNPNATPTLGLEWMPTVQGAVTLDAISKMTAVSLDQSASVGIGTIQIPNAGLGTARGGLFAVEVYDNETAVSDTPVTTTIVPNADVSRQTWTTQSGGTTSLFAGIDDGAYPTVNTADDVRISGVGGTYYGRFTTAALTGKRILAVRMRVYAQIGPTGFLIFGLRIGGVDYNSGVPLAGPSTFAWRTLTWNYNPATRKPWTIADITALNTTDGFTLTGSTQAGVWSAVIVANVALEVINQTENRIAVGTLDDSSGALSSGTPAAPLWNTATMLTPTGGAWTKDGSGRHLYTVRRMNSVGSMAIPYLDTPNGVFASAGRGWAPTVDTTFGYATAMGGALTRLYPFVQRTTAPADHVDSQPYTRLLTGQVFNGQVAQTEFSNAAAANYGVIRFMVNNAGGVTSGLDVKVRRRSDSVQLGTTVTLTNGTYQTLADWGNGWRFVQLQLGTAATLAAATQYYVEFSSTTVAGSSWSVSVPGANGAGTVATFNGTSDGATINGAAEDLSNDIGVTVSTIPAAPASMTAVLGSQAVGETVNCVTAVPRADLSWAVTSLGGTFLRYEVQRSEDGGTTWADIAWVTVESVAAWKDYEAPRGVAVQYRIRVLRQDGAFSPYTAAGASVTKPLLAGTGAYAATLFFVSNYNPTQNLAYEYRPGKDYKFGTSDEQVHDAAYLRDYYVATNPLENRGVVVNWTLIVGADDKVPTGGGKSWTAFDPLLALSRAVIPYVCALDHRGNRLFSQLIVPSGTEDSSGGADLYLASVTAVQVVAAPFVVSVTA